MAKVFIAAAPTEDGQAHVLAEALRFLGFDAAAEAPRDAELRQAVETCACVLAVWAAGPTSPWLAVAAALALDRKKLINLELDSGAAPATFRAAPVLDASRRDRAGVKASVTALLAELEKLGETPANGEALPHALAKARTALSMPSARAPARTWRTVGMAAAAALALGGLSFGAVRAWQALHSGALLVASAPDAQAHVTATPTAAAPSDSDSAWRALERLPWREAAARLGDAEAVLRRASAGEARAQTMACLGHMAGAPGFLPSPSAAREFCDAAAAQGEPAGLYLSWALYRSAPHAGLSRATAQARLRDAAQAGWRPAQVDYALLLAPDARAPLAAQTEAGRLWLAAAEAGDARGQYHYARWLRDSPAGPRDAAAAAPYLARAAEAGLPEALHLLATLHRDGTGVARDPARARALYARAAELEYAPSMFNLADLMRGGGEADRAAAIALYRRLACMRDEIEISRMAQQRLRNLQQAAAC